MAKHIDATELPDAHNLSDQVKVQRNVEDSTDYYYITRQEAYEQFQKGELLYSNGHDFYFIIRKPAHA